MTRRSAYNRITQVFTAVKASKLLKSSEYTPFSLGLATTELAESPRANAMSHAHTMPTEPQRMEALSAEVGDFGGLQERMFRRERTAT